MNKQCPECVKYGKDGTLEQLTPRELAKAGLPKDIVAFGCDECHYIEDEDGTPLN